MELTDFSKGTIWGIVPEYYETIVSTFYDLNAKDLSRQAISYSEKAKADTPYEIWNGVAVIPVRGPITKRASFWSWLFGYASVQSLTYMFQTALRDQKVSSVLLDIDSPGGTVSGIESLADLIYASEKPVVSFANGLMASAAYWIGSAADKIIVENTADIGSIGVLMVHYDYSAQDEQEGVRRSYITSGKYKALGNNAEPLSDFAKGVFQEQLDYLYSIFVSGVAKHRGVETDHALAMADGKIFIGQQAVDIGLGDEVGNFEAALQTAAMLKKTGENRMAETQETKIESLLELTAAYPEFVHEIREQGIAMERNDIRDKAAKDERDRILSMAYAYLGEETGQKFRNIIDAEVTSEQFEAIKKCLPVLSATGTIETEMLKAIQKAGPENPGSGNPTPTGETSLEREAKRRAEARKGGA